MSDGSRWYFPVFEGLFDAKHVEQMGPAVWLYGWVLARAWVAQRGGQLVYSHADAGAGLGVCDKTVRLWFERLQEHGYLITRARRRDHLEVEVVNWRSVAEWLETRTQADGVGSVKNYRSGSVNTYHSEVEIGKEIGKEIGNSLQSTITIRLQGYSYPSGSGSAVPGSLVGAFRELMEALKACTNKPALLQEIYGLCFGASDLPEYGYLGKVARTVGGAGRLAEIMWQLSTKPPTGDVLAYILAQYKAGSRGNGNGHREEPLGFEGIRQAFGVEEGKGNGGS
jgi:hypothetical protein